MDVLRSTLLPVTQNLPGPLVNLGTSIIGPKCYTTLVHNLELQNTECLSLAVSKVAGIGILTLSSIVKIPQILLIVRSGSAQGVSLASIVLETLAYIVSLAYNYRSGWPFSTYGETLMIGLQNTAIGALCMFYGGDEPIMSGLWVAFVGTIFYGLTSPEIVNDPLMANMMVGAGALGVASKIPQIYQNYEEGGTGQLSAFAVFNYLMGSLVRIFTTIQEVDDKLVLYSFVASFLLNAVLAGQMLYYWGNSKSTGQKREVKKVKEGIDVAKEKAPVAQSSGVSSKTKSPTTRRRG
ncbi:hypothetical protein MMC25_007441 [Agyrium rufum]|nr:hypothetical protein [Agyrium rufum]